MSDVLKYEYGIDVFDDQDVYINLLVGEKSMSIDFNIEKVNSIIHDIFYVQATSRTIIVPNEEEYHNYTLKINSDEVSLYDIELKYTRSFNQDRGVEFFRGMSMTAHPRFVAQFLKAFLSEYPSDGFLYGLLELVLVEIDRSIIEKDLDQYTDIEISNILYKPLDSNHLLYKINQGDWVDDTGNWHTYP